jgi:membrane protease YdiL (CAAX protease family)
MDVSDLGHAIAAVAATALAVALVLVQPFAGRRRYQRLLAELGANPRARLRHYRRGMVGEWVIVGVVMLIGVLGGRHLSTIGLARASGHRSSSGWSEVAGVAQALVLSIVIVRLGGASLRRIVRRQARGFLALLPRTAEEKVTFAGLAITAGICEEILFRGFGIAYIRWLWPSAADTAIVAITALCFGWAHLYQGRWGVLLTGAVGALLAQVTLDAGSLYPAMVIHALIDLRVLGLPDLGPADEEERATGIEPAS